jgi:hypothetical protein
MCNIIQIIKSRRMRWAGHVALMWDRRGAYRVLVGKPKGTNPPDMDGRIKLRWVFRKWNGGSKQGLD